MAMFGLPGGGEIWVILVVMLVIFGPSLIAAWLIWLALVRKSGAPGATGPVPLATPDHFAAPVASAGWLPDPAGRHELRYWDGSVWTSDVSAGDVAGQDPL